jgi:predicted DCC family thiol-disulfide oxidoreductase YuxK
MAIAISVRAGHAFWRGLVLTESDAAIHVVAVLGGAFRAIRLARLIPKRWRDGCYRCLARNCYRWFGRRAVCYLPD